MKKVVVIGSGPGGYYSAICLANAGLTVSLIERKNVGGTCLNVGCIPTKVLLDHLSLFEHFKESILKKKIFSASDIKINLEELKAYQTDVIKQLQQGLDKLLKKKKINLILGSAKLVAENKMQVKKPDGSIQEVMCDEIIIATGSKPRSIPGFEFDEKKIVSSDDVWNIPKVPAKLLVIGSGPIGIEFARIFNALGSKVTVVEIQEKICPILDSEISENLVRSLKRRGITVKSNFASKLFSKNENSITVEFISTQDSNKEKEEFDQVLVAVGRKPNTANLGLEDINLELDPAGFVRVSKNLCTNKKNIWAVGDITNYPQLAHTASFQARIVSENILGHNTEFCSNYIPSCIFGYPEIAFVGEREEDLKEKNISYKIGRSLFLASGKAKASGLTEGIVKVLVEENSHKLLGAHIIGPEASNLVHELVVAMQNNITVDKLTGSIHAHPTYSEVVLEAFEDSIGKSVH